MDLSLSVFHIFSDGAVDTRVYSIYGPEYRAPYKFSLLLLLFREIGSPVANFDHRMFSFGRIPPNIPVNEIYFVFREILFFVDFFLIKVIFERSVFHYFRSTNLP